MCIRDRICHFKLNVSPIPLEHQYSFLLASPIISFGYNFELVKASRIPHTFEICNSTGRNTRPVNIHFNIDERGARSHDIPTLLTNVGYLLATFQRNMKT
eukprot:TRINITY_DN0_c1148_g1_i10.p2 TRINITY_DN0_c1148_g1~~TRINITY_DN0_c1148_g1_i10.p2  ORF type:complete len:100 (-),score=9.64 TRINITY_DN0_c1148_g1_i10:320-619(-)